MSQSVARWDGTIWQPLGRGLDGMVHNAAGAFATAGGVPANRIVRWDGSAWSAFGNGLNDTVRALAFDMNGNLYAGGDFNEAGTCIAGSGCTYLARWVAALMDLSMLWWRNRFGLQACSAVPECGSLTGSRGGTVRPFRPQ